MTRGRTQGYRAEDSRLRPGKVVVPFGDRTDICPACREHRHDACWAYLEALGLGVSPVVDATPKQQCPCGCHVAPDDPELTHEAIDDMAEHGTLAAYVKGRQAWVLGSGPLHLKEQCRSCADKARILADRKPKQLSLEDYS